MQKNKKGTVRFHSRATSLSLEGVAPVFVYMPLLERVRSLHFRPVPTSLARFVLLLEGVVPAPPACLALGGVVPSKGFEGSSGPSSEPADGEAAGPGLRRDAPAAPEASAPRGAGRDVASDEAAPSPRPPPTRREAFNSSFSSCTRSPSFSTCWVATSSFCSASSHKLRASRASRSTRSNLRPASRAWTSPSLLAALAAISASSARWSASKRPLSAASRRASTSSSPSSRSRAREPSRGEGARAELVEAGAPEAERPAAGFPRGGGAPHSSAISAAAAAKAAKKHCWARCRPCNWAS